MDGEYNEFIIDSLGDKFLHDLKRMGHVDKENLIQALQRFEYLDPDKTKFTDEEITGAVKEFRAFIPVATDDKKNLIDTIKRNIPLAVDGQAIKINMAHFDPEFDAAIYDLVKKGKIEPLDSNDERGLAQIERLKEGLRKAFAEVDPMFVPQLTFDTTAAERQANNPDNRAFVMISPHDNSLGMGLKGRMERRAKWEAAKDALEDAGAHIKVIHGLDNAGSARETYTRDRALIIGDVAYIPDVEYALNTPISHDDIYQYRKDAVQIAEFLESQGYKIVHVENAWFEGGNVVLHKGEEQNTVFLGMDHRHSEPLTDKVSAGNLIEAINATQDQKWTLQGVPMIDTHEGGSQKLYHLDLGMSYALPNGEHIIYPGITDPDTYSKIQETIGKDNIIEIDKSTALLFATNFNHVGNTIIMTDTTPELQGELEGRGYKVVTPDDYDLDTFEFGQGGVHCMTNEISWKPLTK